LQRKKKLSLRLEYERLCEKVSEANQEIFDSLTWKIEELYYALSTDTKKASISGPEDVKMSLNGEVVLIQSEKFEENGVIVKKVSVTTNPKFIILDACEESDGSYADLSDCAEESDIEDEAVTQSMLDDLEQSFIIHKKLA